MPLVEKTCNPTLYKLILWKVRRELQKIENFSNALPPTNHAASSEEKNLKLEMGKQRNSCWVLWQNRPIYIYSLDIFKEAL